MQVKPLASTTPPSKGHDTAALPLLEYPAGQVREQLVPALKPPEVHAVELTLDCTLLSEHTTFRVQLKPLASTTPPSRGHDSVALPLLVCPMGQVRGQLVPATKPPEVHAVELTLDCTPVREQLVPAPKPPEVHAVELTLDCTPVREHIAGGDGGAENTWVNTCMALHIQCMVWGSQKYMIDGLVNRYPQSCTPSYITGTVAVRYTQEVHPA